MKPLPLHPRYDAAAMPRRAARYLLLGAALLLAAGAWAAVIKGSMGSHSYLALQTNAPNNPLLGRWRLSAPGEGFAFEGPVRPAAYEDVALTFSLGSLSVREHTREWVFKGVDYDVRMRRSGGSTVVVRVPLRAADGPIQEWGVYVFDVSKDGVSISTESGIDLAPFLVLPVGTQLGRADSDGLISAKASR